MPDKKLSVTMGTGYRPDKNFWVPMSTGYWPDKKIVGTDEYRVAAR